MGDRVTAADVPILVAVGVLAGVISTVASLASIVSYPALLAVGLPPLSANVTNTGKSVRNGASVWIPSCGDSAAWSTASA